MNNKKHGNHFIWFMGLMGKRFFAYLAVILVTVFGSVLTRISTSRSVEKIVSAAQSRNAEGVLLAVCVNFAFYILAWMIWRFGIIRYNIEAKKSTARLEKMIFSKATRLPMSYYESNHTGDFLSKLIYDTERAGDIYGSKFRALLTAVLSVALYFVSMCAYNAALSLCLLVLCTVSFALEYALAKALKGLSGELSAGMGRLTARLGDIISGIEVMKIFPAAKRQADEYCAENESLYNVQKKSNRLSAILDGIDSAFDLTSALAFLLLGLYFVSNGWINLGELAAIYTLYGSLKYCFADIGKYFSQMLQCMANVDSIYDFLALDEEPASYGGCVAKKSAAEAVEIENLSFSYNMGKRVFCNYSAKFERGICTAIVGESGCGKSTLAKLILGFYKPDAGDIIVNGKSILACGLVVLMVPGTDFSQEAYLFNASIAENIAYGAGSRASLITREEIVEAARAANAHDFIMRLPDGYDTKVGERGNTLSGGQKQRIAIARAILKNAPIFLFDEATSALDSESERLVNDAVKNLKGSHTVIIIAHREATIAMADRREWV